MRPFLFPLFFALIFCACDIKVRNNFKLETTQIKVPITHEQLAFYPVASVYHTDSTVLFAGYNYAYQTIDLFDLSRATFLRALKIVSEGPEGIPSLSRLYAGRNFIVTASLSLFCKIDYQGNIIKKYQLKNFDHDLERYTLHPDVQILNFKPFGYNEPDDFILMNLFNTAKKSPGQFYSESLLFCKIHLAQGKIESVPVGYPEEFQSDSFFGDLDTPNGLYVNDSLIYNFPASSKIFVFYSGRTSEKDIRPASTPAQSPPLTQDDYTDTYKRLHHSLSSPQFFGLVRHERYKFYIRIHKGYTEKLVHDHSKNHLTFISARFNKSFEVPLSEKLNPVAFPVSDGFLFQQKYTENEKFLVFQKISPGKDLLHFLKSEK